MSKRLSATDISALASMKNVAKCDTWCELQNPVNHRVFERKLRPKPLGRGHVCLGVTRRCPPRPLPESGGTDGDLPCASRAVGLNIESPATGAATIGGCETSVSCRARVRRGLSRTLCVGHPTLSTRPQVRRGYPLNLSISISGGKETYKDSSKIVVIIEYIFIDFIENCLSVMSAPTELCKAYRVRSVAHKDFLVDIYAA